MNCATYLRVSTTDQSTAAQRLELQQYAALRGWTIVAEYEDTISGTKADRAGLNQLMAEVAARKYDAVLVVKLDRMCRSLAHFSAVVALFAKAGVAFVCTSQGIDTSKGNACGEMQAGVLAVIAQFERSLIAERTKAGLAVARANGKTLGRVSKRMPASREERAAVVATWMARSGGTYEELGAALGGVSRATAWRLVKKYLADHPEAPAPRPPEEVEV